MPSLTPARRVPLQTLAIAPLLSAALLIGTVGSPPASTAAGSGAPTVATAPTQGQVPVQADGPRVAAHETVTVATRPVAYVTPASIAIPRGLNAVQLAAAQKGKPYRYGGAGPRSFDCSGLVYYIYKKKLHVNLPRTANAQRKKAIRISKSQVRPGDLIFFMSGGRAYHVGIYAGHGKVWHSPMPGQRVKLSKIWTSKWRAGRVR